jgi:hypothetical protein
VDLLDLLIKMGSSSSSSSSWRSQLSSVVIPRYPDCLRFGGDAYGGDAYAPSVRVPRYVDVEGVERSQEGGDAPHSTSSYPDESSRGLCRLSQPLLLWKGGGLLSLLWNCLQTPCIASMKACRSEEEEEEDEEDEERYNADDDEDDDDKNGGGVGDSGMSLCPIRSLADLTTSARYNRFCLRREIDAFGW